MATNYALSVMLRGPVWEVDVLDDAPENLVGYEGRGDFVHCVFTAIIHAFGSIKESSVLYPIAKSLAEPDRDAAFSCSESKELTDNILAICKAEAIKYGINHSNDISSEFIYDLSFKMAIGFLCSLWDIRGDKTDLTEDTLEFLRDSYGAYGTYLEEALNLLSIGDYNAIEAHLTAKMEDRSEQNREKVQSSLKVTNEETGLFNIDEDTVFEIPEETSVDYDIDQIEKMERLCDDEVIDKIEQSKDQLDQEAGRMARAKEALSHRQSSLKINSSDESKAPKETKVFKRVRFDGGIPDADPNKDMLEAQTIIKEPVDSTINDFEKEVFDRALDQVELIKSDPPKEVVDVKEETTMFGNNKNSASATLYANGNQGRQRSNFTNNQQNQRNQGNSNDFEPFLDQNSNFWNRRSYNGINNITHNDYNNQTIKFGDGNPLYLHSDIWEQFFISVSNKFHPNSNLYLATDGYFDNGLPVIGVTDGQNIAEVNIGDIISQFDNYAFDEWQRALGQTQYQGGGNTQQRSFANNQHQHNTSGGSLYANLDNPQQSSPGHGQSRRLAKPEREVKPSPTQPVEKVISKEKSIQQVLQDTYVTNIDLRCPDGKLIRAFQPNQTHMSPAPIELVTGNYIYDLNMCKPLYGFTESGEYVEIIVSRGKIVDYFKHRGDTAIQLEVAKQEGTKAMFEQHNAEAWANNQEPVKYDIKVTKGARLTGNGHDVAAAALKSGQDNDGVVAFGYVDTEIMVTQNMAPDFKKFLPKEDADRKEWYKMLMDLMPTLKSDAPGVFAAIDYRITKWTNDALAQLIPGLNVGLRIDSWQSDRDDLIEHLNHEYKDMYQDLGTFLLTKLMKEIKVIVGLESGEYGFINEKGDVVESSEQCALYMRTEGHILVADIYTEKVTDGFITANQAPLFDLFVSFKEKLKDISAEVNEQFRVVTGAGQFFTVREVMTPDHQKPRFYISDIV